MPEGVVIPGKALNGANVSRIQGEGPFPFRDGLLESPLVEEIPGLIVVSPSVGRIEGEGLRYQFVRPPGICLGVCARAHIDRHEELGGQSKEGVDIVGIDAERLLAERVTRIRFFAEKSGFLHDRKTLDSCSVPAFAGAG